MADTEKVEKAETEQVEEKSQIEETQEEIIEEEIKVEGNDIIINGEKYDPNRAVELLRKQRKFEKDLEKANKKLASIEEAEQKRKEADLSEKEKAELRAEKAEKQLAELTLKEQQREAAEKAGLPAAFADRIKGQTPEEMEEDAKQLLAAIPKTKSTIGVTNPGPNATIQEETKEQTFRRLGLTRQ